jgi:hypothetical protein
METLKRPKTGGRTAGVPNKTPNQTKLSIQKLINRDFKNIESLMQDLTNKEKLDFYIKLLPYILPRQQFIEVQEQPQTSKFTPLSITVIQQNEPLNNNSHE